MEQQPKVVDLIRLPPNSSSLTAHPSEDLSQADWLTVHTIPVTDPPSTFWHTIHSFTHIDHWNRTLCALHLQSAVYTPHSFSSDKTHQQRLAQGAKYTALRTFRRKTPAPIGDTTPCFTATEWTLQYIQHHNTNVAIFALAIPASIVTPQNPRALRYWPFQYPKVRAYRFTYNYNPNQTSTLSYDVLPLTHHNLTDYSALLHHSRPAADKLLTMIRKQAEYRNRYDSMKQKYAYWAQQWTECTDPQKFVFEEMAIAAYLCALWECGGAVGSTVRVCYDPRRGSITGTLVAPPQSGLGARIMQCLKKDKESQPTAVQ